MYYFGVFFSGEPGLAGLSGQPGTKGEPGE